MSLGQSAEQAAWKRQQEIEEAEERQRRFEAAAKAAKERQEAAEREYWQKMEQQNLAALSQPRSTNATLAQVEESCSPKAFTGRSKRLLEARKMKVARRLEMREEAERRHREQELKRQQEELKAGGGSFRERQLLQMAQAAEQGQADALQRLMVERAAKVRRLLAGPRRVDAPSIIAQHRAVCGCGGQADG